MREISLDGSPESPGGRLRARRWDAVVLGGALPGLVAAVRMGMAGLRVLVVEEETAARIPPLLREPFFLPAPLPDSPVQRCLVALGLPLIERRAIAQSELAYQLVLPDARIDVGLPGRTQEELVGWGLAKPEVAHELVRALESAAHAEAEVLLRSGVVRGGARPAAAGPPGRHMRGLPAVLRQAEPGFAALLEAQVRALSHLGSGEPSPEATARLLGSALAGGAVFPAGRGLRALARRRVEELHGEFRTVATPFELAEIDGHPALVLQRSRDAWLGRALVLNLHEGCLTQALQEDGLEVPGFLRAEPPQRRRAALQLTAIREALPEALAPRAILGGDADGTPTTLAVLPSERGSRYVELVVTRALSADGRLSEAHDRMEAEVRALLPFSEKKLARVAVADRPRWDDELALSDLAPGGGWPSETDLRAGARTQVYRLCRHGVAGLGSEGDLLLGWQAGDALTATLR